MANSYQRATSDGTMTMIDISIEYLDRSEITVFFDDVLTSAWSWSGTTDKRILFSPMPVPDGVVVMVKRTTDSAQLRHEFSRGAKFTAETLDEDLQQALHIAQEAHESAPSGEFFQDINMHGYSIRNLTNGVNPQDAMTIGQYQSDIDGTAANAAAAAASAAAAAASAAQAAALVASQGLVTVIGDGVTNNNAELAAAIASGKVIAHAGTGPWVITTPLTFVQPLLDKMTQIFRIGDPVTLAAQQRVRPEWFGSSGLTLKAAIDSLPSTGGEIQLAYNTYFHVGAHYIAPPYSGIMKPNVKIYGVGRARKASDRSRFVHGTGSVVQGSLVNYSNGFKAFDLSVDVGSYVTTTYAAQFVIGQPEGFVPGTHRFQGTPNDVTTYIQDVEFANISVLAVSNLNHGCLIEFINGVNHGYVEVDGGYHGYVVKSQNVQGTLAWAYNQTGGDGYIFKSDQYTKCNYVQLGTLRLGRRGSANRTAGGLVQSTTGYVTSHIQVGQFQAFYCDYPFRRTGDSEYITDIMFGSYQVDDTTGDGFDVSDKMRRIYIGKHDISNCTGYGINVNDTATLMESIDIGTGSVLNCALDGYYMNFPALQYGDLFATGNTLYGVRRIGSTPMDPNKLQGYTNGLGLVSSYWEILTGANLQNNWIDNGSGVWPFQVVRIGQTLKVRGTIRLNSGTGLVCATLPVGHRPAFVLSFCTVAVTAGGVRSFAHVDVAAGGTITIANAVTQLGGAGAVAALNFEVIL